MGPGAANRGLGVERPSVRANTGFAGRLTDVGGGLAQGAVLCVQMLDYVVMVPVSGMRWTLADVS